VRIRAEPGIDQLHKTNRVHNQVLSHQPFVICSERFPEQSETEEAIPQVFKIKDATSIPPVSCNHNLYSRA
jgi:hypothetical protein